MLFDLFRPAWKSKRKERRLKALRGGQLEKAQIETLAQYDPEDEVRRAAIALIDEDTQLYRLWLSERQEDIQDNILDLLAERLNSELTPLERLKALCNSVNVRSFPLSGLIERLHCKESKDYLFSQIISLQELWAMAGVRGDYQLEALRRFDDQAALENLYKTLRSTDQGAASVVKERLDELAEFAKKEARRAELIEEYRQFAESSPLKPVNLLSRLHATWKEEGFAEDKERDRLIKIYQERFQLESRREVAKSEEIAPDADENREAEIESAENSTNSGGGKKEGDERSVEQSV